MATHKPAARFETEGERRTVKALCTRLPPNAYVISNLCLPLDRGGQSVEIDAVVVMPLGVVLVEVKDWVGNVEFGNGYCEKNGDPVDDPRESLARKGKILFSRIKRFGAKTTEVVILAHENVRLEVKATSPVFVDRLESAVPALSRGLYCRQGQPPLSQAAMKAIVEDLLGSHDEKHRRRIGDYVVGDPIDPEGVEHWAIEQSTGQRVRLRRHTIDGFAEPRERTEEHRAAKRFVEALRKLQSRRLRALPVAYACVPHPKDDSTFWTAYEDVEGTPLIEAKRSIRDKVSLLADVADALAACHKAGVIHRGLKPEAILATETGVSLIGFDLARLDGAQTIAAGKARVQLGKQTRAAPEVRLNPSRATPASDIYAFGFVTAETLSGRRAKTAAEVKALAGKLRPRELGPLVHRMISDEPARRFSDMSAIADALRKLRVS